MFLRFWLPTGKYLDEYYGNLIHIRDDYLKDDIFGDAPGEALKELMDSGQIIKIGGGRYTSYTWNWEK